MAALLLYILIVSMLFAVAAAGTEQLCRQRGWPQRLVWLVTLFASLAFPLGIALTTQPSITVESSSLLATSPGPSPVAASLTVTRLRPDSSANAPAVFNPIAPPPSVRAEYPTLSADAILATAWLTSSACTLLFLAVTWIRLSIRFRRCPRQPLCAVEVTVTDDTGPAVFGFFDRRILVPKWLLNEPVVTQSVAIAHERQHLKVGDPQLLLVGLCLVAIAPWNPVLWWQLRRLRFAMEADCDARVLNDGVNPSTYAEVLLNVIQHRTPASVGLMALAARTSNLEQRVRAFTAGTVKKGWARSAIGLLLVIGAIVIAACVHAPGLASHELRKRPPQDVKPPAESATAAARSHFPELFTKHFDGTAVVAVMFNRDGSLNTIAKHLFAPNTVPADLDLKGENAQQGIDSEDDIMIRGGEYPPWTIGPWVESKNPNRILVVYEVLKWPHDPARTRARVQAALAAYDPSLLGAQRDTTPGSTIQLTVWMNDDGTVNRESKRALPPGTSITEDEIDRFEALGVRKEQLGRRGFALGLGNTMSDTMIRIDYAWPRRVDEAADIADSNIAWRDLYTKYPDREDTQDDAAIISRYFPDIERRGHDAARTTVDGKEVHLQPWILLGRDGRVWDSGRALSWPTHPRGYEVASALSNSTVLETHMVHDIVPGSSVTARGARWVRTWRIGSRSTGK